PSIPWSGNERPNVQPDSNYSYRVRAFNNFGDSAYSNEDTIKTLPAAPPNTPSNVHVTNIGGNKALVTWTDNSNNEEGFTVGSFYYPGVEVPPNTTSYTLELVN